MVRDLESITSLTAILDESESNRKLVVCTTIDHCSYVFIRSYKRGNSRNILSPTRKYLAFYIVLFLFRMSSPP